MLYINYTSILLFTTTLTLHTVTRGGFRGGVRGVRPPTPPKIRKAYVIQR
jgi:hypothetical protein